MPKLTVLKHTLRAILRHPLMRALYAPALLFTFAGQMIAPLLPLYVGDFDVSYGIIGLVLACNALGTMLGDIPAGMLLRRWSQKTAMLAGIMLYAVSILALSMAWSIWLVVIALLLNGIGFAVYKVAQHAYLTEAITVTNRGRASSGIGGILRIGGFVGSAAGGAIAGLFGMRVAFVVAGLIGATALVFVVRYQPAIPVSRQEQETGARRPVLGTIRESLRGVWATLRTHARILGAAGTGQVFAQLVRSGRSVILPLYAADVIGLSVSQIGVLVSLSWGMDMVLFSVAGLIMDRWGRKYSVVPAFAIQAVGMMLIPLTGSFAGLLAVALLLGFGNGISAGSMLAIGGDLAPEQGRGDFLGLWHLIGDLGGAGAPLLVGGIADLLVLPAAAMVLAGAGFAASFTFARFVPETLHKPSAVPEEMPEDRPHGIQGARIGVVGD
ncbi:MAG: MFS transporter [Anaerolineae bacterium]|nr:MFS transporter [Anaerolineae bacterium]